MNSQNLVAEIALVLVAVLNFPRDFEMSRMLGWFRIPLRYFPKVLDVNCLAFYQTSGFDKEENGRIQYKAKVNGHKLTTRIEQLFNEQDHPRANEEYIKIQLGPLICLPNLVITTSWKRNTFRYSIGKYLLEANVVNDLVIRSYERAIHW